MRDGSVAIVDETNANVLSFVRTAPAGAKPVLVVLNLTSAAQIATIDLAKVKMGPGDPKTLLASPGFQAPTVLNTTSISLPSFAVWIAEID